MARHSQSIMKISIILLSDEFRQVAGFGDFQLRILAVILPYASG